MASTLAEGRQEQGGGPSGPRLPSPRTLAVIAGVVVVVLVVLVVTLVRLLGGGSGGPAPKPGPTPRPAAGPLAWAPPQLVSPTTVKLTDDHHDLKLDKKKDYVVQLPPDGLHVQGTSIWGGHNVVLIGGEIDVPADDPGRGLALKSQTGTLHVEGLWITGDGLREGINLDQPSGAVVQLENLRVDAPNGSRSTNHADVIQSWAGPRVLRIDRLSATTTYQGFFLLPNQHDKGPQPEGFDLRHVDLRGLKGSGYMLWRDGASWPVAVQDVYVRRPGSHERTKLLWPKKGEASRSWSQVHVGTPPGGSFVPDGVAGTGYKSPGYA
jgi:hypothetical protein